MPTDNAPIRAQTRHILVIGYLNSHLPNFIALARFLRSQRRYQTTVLFTNATEPIKQEYVRVFDELGVKIYDREGKNLFDPDAPSLIPRSPAQKPLAERQAPRIAKGSSLFKGLYAMYRIVIECQYQVRRLRRSMRESKRLLKTLQPDLLILPEENALLETSIYTKTGARLGIPSVVLPYTIANATEFAESMKDEAHLQVQGPMNSVVARLFPRWVYTYKGKRLLLNPISRLIANELLRLSPPDPWMINSGFADAIAVESKTMHDYYRVNRIPERRLILTGSLNDDVLTRQLGRRAEARVELCQSLGLDANRPILLCGLQPFWPGREECDFRTFEELIDFLMGALEKVQGYNRVINLHPRVDYDQVKYIESKFDVKICRQNIAELLPLCDLYVANISATIRWAIACGVPVLNYDLYRWGFHDYDQAGGVITLDRQNAFINMLTRLTTDKEFYSGVHERQRHSSASWGMLDGRSGERLVALFDRLIESPRARMHLAL